MSGAPSLAFPGSRKLAGWWRQLAPLKPQSLWVGHLLLHHVEALVRFALPCSLDGFTLFLLRALALEEGEPVSPGAEGRGSLSRLESRLHVGRPVLRQALEELEREGLVQTGAEERRTLTAQGHEALRQRAYPRAEHERRAFHFLDRREGPRDAASSFYFLSLRNATGIVWPEVEGMDFDARVLQTCIGQPLEWKKQHGFPLDVQEIVGTEVSRATAEDGPRIRAGPPQPEVWRRVIIDRPLQILALLCLAPGLQGEEQVLGWPIRQDGWALQTGEPLFTLGAGWPEVFPELGDDVGPPGWQQAWREWSEQRGLPAAEVRACLLERVGTRLRVRAPARLVERLRATRSDALRGEAWLLAGEDRIRPMAQVDLVENLN
jgi:hypothetical protein